MIEDSSMSSRLLGAIVIDAKGLASGFGKRPGVSPLL